MVFKKMCVGKYSYGTDDGFVENIEDVTNFNFHDDIFLDHLNDPTHENHQNIIKMLTLLSVCHTVIVQSKRGQLYYNASSPDELALVNAGKAFGVVFKGRDDANNIDIDLFGRPMKYELLNVIEFTSAR